MKHWHIADKKLRQGHASKNAPTWNFTKYAHKNVLFLHAFCNKSDKCQSREPKAQVKKICHCFKQNQENVQYVLELLILKFQGRMQIRYFNYRTPASSLRTSCSRWLVMDSSEQITTTSQASFWSEAHINILTHILLNVHKSPARLLHLHLVAA